MEKKHRLSIFIIILCLIILSVVSVSIYRQYKLDTYLQYKLPKSNKTLITKWLDALKADNSKEALFLASKMVPKSSPYVPLPYYIDMTSQSDINSRFFNPPFTELDYLYWKDAYDIRSIVNNAINNPKIKNIPKHFFDIIFKDIKLIKQDKQTQRSAFLFEIWNKKKCGVFNKFLLFSEFMTQAGYDVQVAVMFEDIKKPPVHIISEIRKGSEVYSCDFMTGNFWNKSIKELATNKNLVKSYWNKRWVKGLDHLLLKTEASAMSYRKVNQELHKYLSRDNNKNIPIIGLDPYKKMEEYIRTYYPNYTNSSKLSFILGIEPFTMIKNSKSFPKKWLTEKKK